MAPLWDTTHSKQSSAGFCFTTSNLHSFSQEPDLSFLIAFSDSITAETSRLANIDAEKKKADFIGSISHELRSPLHGILASGLYILEATDMGLTILQPNSLPRPNVLRFRLVSSTQLTSVEERYSIQSTTYSSFLGSMLTKRPGKNPAN